jgi:hypothetical protein
LKNTGNQDKLSELLEEQIDWRDKDISASNGMYDFMQQLILLKWI